MADEIEAAAPEVPDAPELFDVHGTPQPVPAETKVQLPQAKPRLSAAAQNTLKQLRGA